MVNSRTDGREEGKRGERGRDERGRILARDRRIEPVTGE